jgi:transposase
MGPVRSCVIASRVVCPKRFESKHKFWAYCSLVKHESKSDGVLYGKKKIHGNRLLKDCFMGAAQRALETKQEVIAYYQQMLALGFSHKVAKKNIARTLAAISLAVMRTKKKYDPKIWEKKLEASKEKLKTQ